MLFSNFLCLFYLMVIINGHTISKNIIQDQTIDDIVDSIQDLEYRREYKPKHDRLHRYYRKDEKEDAQKPKDGEEHKLHSTTTKLVSDVTELTKLAKPSKPTPKSKKQPGFWQKFKYRGNGKKRNEHKKENEVHKRKAMPRSYRKKQYLQSHPGDRDSKYDNTRDAFNERRIPSLQRNRHTNVDKRKRDIPSIITTVKVISTRSSTTAKPLSSKSPFFKFPTVKMYEPLDSTDNLTKALTAITTRLDDLKKEYGMNSLPTSSTTEMWKNVSTVSPILLPATQTTTEDVDFLGTAQIEALLNDIKIKAVQMMSEQIPAITDIITNTVTETTFAADPILSHISTPGYALSTFISIDSDSLLSKRTACDIATGPKVNDTVVIANTEPTHHVSVRSINEDVFTIAHTIEDILQKELKKVLNKVKGKSSSQLAEEVKQVKATAKQQTDKMMKKITNSDKKKSSTRVTSPMTTPKTMSRDHTEKRKGSMFKQMRRSPKHGKHERKKGTSSLATTQSTFDDYVMLTLFENILTKTHEDNVMRMLTTPSIASKDRHYLRLFKRAPETLARVSLKENEQKLYDEVILPDEFLNYGTKTNSLYSTSTEAIEDTSYEGLSNKISYNDYVNGYRHYLKFQREQGNQNFSNLIRYQAHRHHSVDDIGKFILNKIPQLPAKRLKRFFDDDIMEDQDISTKSDDSWFKKHFYFLIDNGPPKKFHTSQTVELKSPTDPNLGSSGTEDPVLTPRPKNKGLTEHHKSFGEIKSVNQDSIEDNLDELSKALDERKSKEFMNVMPQKDKLNLKSAVEAEEDRNKKESPEYKIFKGLGSIGLVDKLFRRAPKLNTKYSKQNTEELSELDREKRNTNKIDLETNNLYTSQSNTLRSTVTNVIETRNKNYGYVDVNLIPRPTAIVKLRENKQKKGKLRKFFNKFRLPKRNKHKDTKKAERTKREYRVQRFNPLKKLKEIFKAKQQQVRPVQNHGVPDYEMITSHIDTFKPVKYDKVMSIEEIKGQIPNITEDLSEVQHSSESWKPDEQPFSFDIPFPSSEASPEIEDTSPVASVTPLTTPKFTEPTSSLKPSSSKKLKLKSSSTQKSTVKSYPDHSYGFDMLSYDLSTYEATKSLEDIRNEIDKLQIKQSMSNENQASTTTLGFSTASHSNDFSVKKIYVPPHIQTVQTQHKPAYKFNVKADPKDIKIQTKLTRIAKFPLSYFTHDHNLKIDPVIERPQIYEYANKDKKMHGKLLVDDSPQKRIRKNSLNTYVTISPKFATAQSFADYSRSTRFNKPYPDYFNDLLMWHGDLLNTDKLTSPQWENILKSLKQDSEVTTQSMVDMQKELVQMKENFKLAESMKTTPSDITGKPIEKIKKDKTRSSNFNKKTHVIKTVALKDNTMAKGNDIIIQGEAKYFHLIKQPDTVTDKYIRAVDLLNNLNKINFKSPAIKYNIEGKIHDAKRNGEFWIDNTEPNNQENNIEQGSSSLLFLDTTLLSYDDGPDFLVDRPKHKKISKNSPVSPKPLKSTCMPRPVTKTNPSPIQYFSTPLPMRNNDFERFLKDNQIDVQSVTTPLFGMPKFVKLYKGSTKEVGDKKEHKSNTDKLSVSKKDQTTPLAFIMMNPITLDNLTNKMDIENNAQDQFTIKDTFPNKYKDVDEKRLKRYSELRTERFVTFEPFRRKPKLGKVKKKIKLFDKKNTASDTPATSSLTDIRYTVISPTNEDDGMQKEVELTIINMNDADQSYDSKKILSEEKTTTEEPKNLTQRAKFESEKTVGETATSKNTHEMSTCLYKLHNNMLYNRKQKDKKKHKSTTTPQTIWNYDNAIWNPDSSFITDNISTTTFHPMINHEQFGSFRAKHPPKRVRISSHSYKYDIIYNDPERQRKNAHSSHKNGHKFAHIAKINNDSPGRPDYSNLTQTIRTSDREHEIVKIVKAVEAVANFTRPNVIIHIDLPTYYRPETGSTEKYVMLTTPKIRWNDYVMKHLSGLALIELLNKCGILKVFDGKINSTDGVDKAVNASKVFSIAEHSAAEKEMNWRTKSRRSRQVTSRVLKPTKSNDNYKELKTMIPNWREKRRLKLFSNISGKLKTLLRKKSTINNTSTTASTKAEKPNKQEKDTTAMTIEIPTIEENKVKREKQEEFNEERFSTIDNGFNVDYDFDVDRIVERATAYSGKKLKAKTKSMKITQKVDDLVLDDASVPYQSLRNEETSTIKDNITSTNNRDLNKETTSTTTPTAKKNLLSFLSPIKLKIEGNHNSKKEAFFDPLSYDSKIYYEVISQTPKSSVNKQTIEPKEDQKLQKKSSETKLEKRDIQPAGKFTAKDVAALEVIVDLVKNTVKYDERDALQEYTENYYLNHPTIVTTSSALPKSTLLTNSIQVHIAIPYNLQVEKKRSLDSYKVRRVFAAKMFSPVDLEYQVQSFDDNKETTTSPSTVGISIEPEYLMTPKMYLLIDANGSLTKGNYPLKPLQGNIDLSKVEVRQVATTKAFATQKAETTSGKSIGKVTLSKDFVAAVNRHLVQLYENLTSLNESLSKHHVQVRDTNIFEDPNKNFRRHINWDAIKKYFGHEGVCNCKCKPNQKMCRACAACDAVISELIFEFDNLAKYMQDHCTEIQTYFWMNPSGGKKLRDTVHKVDQTMHDYFKRVKGKCKERTCKNLSTCIDKRAFVKQKKIPKNYIGDPLIVDLQRVAADIEKTSNLGIHYTDNLIGTGETMINTIGDCIKDISKRETSIKPTSITPAVSTSTTKKPVVKNVYSLDHVNVNIICKPESKEAIASSTENIFSQSPYASLITTGLNFMSNPNFYDYDAEIQHKKRKGLRRFFGYKRLGKNKMKNLFKYYVTKDPDATTSMRIFKKRQTSNQIEAPLVSDTGGIFWKEYLKGQCVNPLPHKVTTTTDKALITTKVTKHVNSKNNANTSEKSRNDVSELKKYLSEVNELMVLTTTNPEKHVFQRSANTTDYSSIDTLSQNINELFKIFHNLTDLNEIENMSTQDLDLSEKDTTTNPKHTKMNKTTKIFKNIKEKLSFKHKSNTTKPINVSETTNIIPTIEVTNDIDSGITYESTLSPNITSENLTSNSTETTSKPTEPKTTTKILKSKTMKTTLNHNQNSSPKSKKKEDSSQSESTEQGTTSLTERVKDVQSKVTDNLKESSQISKKNKDASQSKSTKPETTSITKPTDDNVKEADHLPKLPEKSLKSSFLNKLKMVTLDFFHGKDKELRKTTSILDTNEEIRKSRSPATEKTNSPYFYKNKEENNPLLKPSESDNFTLETTTDTNPTILILNDYGTEMEMGPNVVTNTLGNDNVQNSKKDSSTELNENFRNLLLSVLNYEVKKLNNELGRIKKEDHQVERNSLLNFTENRKRGIFGAYISTENPLNANENDYDILKTLKDLELSTPKGFDIERKDTGLLQKIANKLGVRLVSETHNEKSKVTCMKQQVTQPTTVQMDKKIKGTQKSLPQTTQKHQGDGAGTTKLKQKKLKLDPKYSTILHPIVSVNITSNQEASKPHSGQVCDIDATFKQVQELIQLLPRKDFEIYINNKTCDKYKDLPKYFLIDVTHRKRRKKVKKIKERCSTENIIKWDWIRNKRSLKFNANEPTDTYYTRVTTTEAKESSKDDTKYAVNGDFQGKKSKFASRLSKSIRTKKEMFSSHNSQQTSDYTTHNNAHKQTVFVMDGSEYFEALEKDVNGIYRSRKKRSIRATDINELETGLKNLPYSSQPNESYAMLGDSVIIQCATNKMNARDDRNEFRWITDRKGMLSYDNVIVDGPRLVIREVEAKNLGEYTCQKGNAAQRKIRLTVITLPTFKVMFTPVYSIDGECTYDDLKAVQSLGTMMSREACSDDRICSVIVDEPVCLRDRVSNTAYLRLTAMMSVPPKGDVHCSGRCRRDLHNSLALMSAANAPALASVKVLIINDGLNKTLVPSFSSDSTTACPLGSCPDPGHGSRAPKSLAQDSPLGNRYRRCYWVWYPSCGWCAAAWAAACACAAAAALIHARGAPRAPCAPRDPRARGMTDVNKERTRSPRARPLSPSRVILAKFFRTSHTSTKATDSQETKFGLWKEKNLPPPLPPIDFDI